VTIGEVRSAPGPRPAQVAPPGFDQNWVRTTNPDFRRARTHGWTGPPSVAHCAQIVLLAVPPDGVPVHHPSRPRRAGVGAGASLGRMWILRWTSGVGSAAFDEPGETHGRTVRVHHRGVRLLHCQVCTCLAPRTERTEGALGCFDRPPAQGRWVRRLARTVLREVDVFAFHTSNGHEPLRAVHTSPFVLPGLPSPRRGIDRGFAEG